jgi:hypothetical protein
MHHLVKKKSARLRLPATGRDTASCTDEWCYGKGTRRPPGAEAGTERARSGEGAVKEW